MTRDFTLKDIEKIIDKAIRTSNNSLEKRLTEKFDASLNKFAEITMERFDSLEDKLERFQLETKEEFRAVRREFRMSQANQDARIAILEEKVL